MMRATMLAYARGATTSNCSLVAQVVMKVNTSESTTLAVSVRYPGDEKICPEDWTRNFEPCAFMELATPDFCATGRQWVLLLATTLRQRDEARREAEASRGDNVGRRRSGKRSTVGRGRVRRRRATRRLKSASSANELGVGRARACEDEEATRRRGNARLKARNRKLGQFGRKSDNARGKAARNERPGVVGGGSPGRRRTDVRRLAGKGRGHLRNAAACGKPYARNGEKVTEFVEVRACKRRCRRPRYRMFVRTEAGGAAGTAAEHAA